MSTVSSITSTNENGFKTFVFSVALMWMVALALTFITKGQLGYELEQYK